MTQGQAARRAAFRLISHVLIDRRLLNEIAPDPSLAPADRARAQRLAQGTLRHLPRLDAVLDQHLRKAPPAKVRGLLRLGAFELVQGGAAHGVVNAYVTLAAANRKTAPLKGLVNAVLRKVAATGAADFAALPPSCLPDWLRAPLIRTYGADRVARMEAVHAMDPPLDLTAKPGAANLPDGTALPTGSVRLHQWGQVSALPGYDTGDWWVQDAAAAMPARLLAPQPGEHVLDMCAAPGGKTLQMAVSGAEVAALDISAARTDRIKENLDRTALNARIVVKDALTFQGGPFDAILLDAPCSATGTIRRHPDLPHAKDLSGLASLTHLQSDLIDRAVALLAPGGRFVFCTCSLLPEEGEAQAKAALARHPALQPDDAALSPEWVAPDWHAGPGQLRLTPDIWADQGGIDGFFIAAFRLRQPQPDA